MIVLSLLFYERHWNHFHYFLDLITYRQHIIIGGRVMLGVEWVSITVLPISAAIYNAFRFSVILSHWSDYYNWIFELVAEAVMTKRCLWALVNTKRVVWATVQWKVIKFSPKVYKKRLPQRKIIMWHSFANTLFVLTYIVFSIIACWL